MIKICVKLFIILFMLSVANLCEAQDLRIDFKRINREKKHIKINGEYLTYLNNEVQNLANTYGKFSKEYIYLRGYYLEEYNSIYQPYKSLNPISLKEYTEGTKELVELNKKVYGDISVQYSEAILSYVGNFSVPWSPALTDSSFNELMALTNKAVNNIKSNDSISEEIKYDNLEMLYAQKGNIFLKIGKKDSTLKYYDLVLDLKKKYPFFDYDNFFPSFLGLYANVISDNNIQKGLDFLLEYEPLIKKGYATRQDRYYNFLLNLLDKFINGNNFNNRISTYLQTADSLCVNTFGESSKEYVNFILYYKIAVFKKISWTSLVYNQLTNLDENIFKKNPALLSDRNIYMQYQLEWYYYFESINEKEVGIKWLKNVEISVSDSSLNRFTLNTKRTIYRKLADYYQFRNFDTCLNYYIKVLNLEIKAKEEWGDYVIHQYAEIAKLLVSTENPFNYDYANKYCLKALDEFERAYGKESNFYKSAQATLGRLHFLISKGKYGINEMTPLVYSQLNNELFVPPLNTSVFEIYGDMLNQVNMPDSADFFYNQIYLRNSISTSLFRILGQTQDYQLKSLNEIYSQNYFILSQLLNRYTNQGYKYVSRELAEKIFKKNLIYNVQSYLHEAIENVKSEKDTIYLNWIRKDRACYDSILYSGSRDNKLIDSVYDQYDLDRNWILQAYIVNNTTDSSKFQNLRKEYSYTNIQKNLKDSECFIDIIRFLKGDKNLGFNPKPYYAFVIVNNNQEEKLEYFFLEDGESLEELVKEDKNNTGKLTALLSPLLLKLKKYKKIYICPDGAFNLLNFYSLKDENGDFLINSKSIHYIDDPSKMFQSDSLLNRNKTISFFGNPAFKNYSHTNINSERNSVFKSSIFSSFNALPYTMLEIYASAAVLSKNGWEVKKYTGTECSEINLKKDNSPGILHIATHGYYIPENDTTDIPYAIQKNPYLRSGLVLGDVGNNKKSLNDNILTAFEVMDLDLKNTSLVVLSACKSAEGELKPGQGVYGLQRAFKIAGARNVLVSVKNVDDKATQLLMGYFYSNVAIGENYTNALKNAQLQMIKNPLFNNSKYWDGFILIGQ